jgi:hypothetical protein
MTGTERTWNTNTGRYDSRTTKTSEDISRATDRERMQDFRAPDRGSTPTFHPPKQTPGESLGSWQARVKKARIDFDEGHTREAQKQALKDLP